MRGLSLGVLQGVGCACPLSVRLGGGNGYRDRRTVIRVGCGVGGATDTNVEILQVNLGDGFKVFTTCTARLLCSGHAPVGAALHRAFPQFSLSAPSKEKMAPGGLKVFGVTHYQCSTQYSKFNAFGNL